MVLNVQTNKLKFYTNYKMSSSRIPTFVYLLISLAFLLQTASRAEPLFHFCSDTGNFSAYDPYESNLHKLSGYLSIQAPPLVGSASVPLVTTRTESTASHFAGAMCRAEIVKPASSKQAARYESDVPTSKRESSGTITVFKYSNVEFSGQIDIRNRFYMWNLNNVSEPQDFNGETKGLLTELANQAYANPKMYAIRERELYGLTQCTRDLSSGECKKCLDGIIGELPSCCDGKEGGRVVGGSCNFRYEIYPFVNTY